MPSPYPISQILQFDQEAVYAQKVRAHSLLTKQRGSDVRTGHKFFGEVCDALVGNSEVLVIGCGIGMKDFER